MDKGLVSDSFDDDGGNNVVSRLEEVVRDELRKLKIPFRYESAEFPLTNKVNYTPDFYLLKTRKHNKKVLLEPHGLWTEPEKRLFRLNKMCGSIWVPRTEVDLNELEFVWKLALFRKMYGKQFHLILFVPPRCFEWVKVQYPMAYDEVYPVGDIPKVLTQFCD